MHTLLAAGWLAVCLGLWAGPAAKAESADMRVGPPTLGVFPYMSPAVLAARHGPLRAWLAEELDAPVNLVTAPDFATFARRTCRGDYTLALTAPHLGRLAQRDCGQVVLAVTGNRSSAVFVARRDAGLTSLADLRGQTLHAPPELAIVHQLGVQALSEAGLVPSRDLRVETAQSHSSALLAVLHQGGVGLVGLPTWLDAQRTGRGELVEVHRTEEIPGFVLLGNPTRLPPQRLIALSRDLFALHAEPAGHRYFQGSGLVRFMPPDPGLLEGLDPFADRAARVLGDG
ncbi:phosphate/phosphite/phosphonate ABC transporter substrate-binding protein [Thioalkalivibrio sulfidiphilus]|uniref:phosphate/phosphite/phosphonate ABC transporter substrate-binding protein n=1 Tax=Thioalkalivibrio sulfidiphilus TaxID=1033854 RepID=UPI0003755DE7|nr:phosphate/phosphite/phosphonate ABC transporter substrate-binding protein [Thioalkalivibrio sulfidiphilus]